MGVERLSQRALDVLVNNKIKKRAKCIIKVYANHCKYCHELHDTYEEIIQLYPDVHFFAFNIADDPGLEKRLKFDGVPTILFVKTGLKGQVKVMPEPSEPHDKTWYHMADVKKFIEENN